MTVFQEMRGTGGCGCVCSSLTSYHPSLRRSTDFGVFESVLYEDHALHSVDQTLAHQASMGADTKSLQDLP